MASRFESKILLSVVVLTMLLVAGCSSDAPEPAALDSGPSRGGTAVFGSISDIDSWNEYLSRQSFASNVLRRIYLRLAEEQGDGQEHPASFEPLLAESWGLSDDGLALTFELREAQWSDGTPISAGDVRFTWLAQTSEDVPWVGASSKSRITDVVVEDDRIVTFHFDRIYPFQLADAVDGGIIPEHVFGEVPFDRWVTHDWSTVSIASGPFLLERHSPGHEIVLARNPRYFRAGFPLLDRVVVRIVPDISNLVTQLRTGDIDYVEGLTPRDAYRLSDDGRITLLPFDHPDYDFLGWNGSKAPFDDPVFRRAMTLAIDRQALVDDLLFGYGQVSKGPVLSFWWGAARSLEPWPHDPAEARRLLANMGYRVRHDAGKMSLNGKPLELQLLTNAGNQLRLEMLLKVQEQLAKVGIAVEVSTLEMRTFRQRVTSGKYDGFLGGWIYSMKDLEAIFGSEHQPPRGLNVVHYSSRQVDRMFEELGRVDNWLAMKPSLKEIQHRIHEDQPYTFLYEKRRIAAHGVRLGGVTIEIPGDPLANLESFWIR